MKTSENVDTCPMILAGTDTAHKWVNQNPEILPEDVGTFLGKISY
jgi:hypothetical protein